MDYSMSELENLDLENITFRRPRRSSSMCDVSHINNTTTLDTSQISLPNRSFEESYSMLNDQIKKLSTELDSANQEIVNLNLENKNLKLDLDKLKKVINIYKRMSLTGTMVEQAKDRHSTKKQKTKIKGNFVTTHVNQNLNINNQIAIDRMDEYYNNYEDEKLIVPFKSNDVTTCSKSVTYAKVNDVTTTNNSKNLNKSNYSTKKRVVILSDQQGRHICKYLQRLLGDNYFVSSFCKPGSNMSTVLNSDIEYISTLNDNDFVIVIGGTNDRNPYEFQSSLLNWMQMHGNVNILFSEVPYNNILNENKLNYELKFICSKYNNATYIDMNYSRFIPAPKNFFVYLSRMLLREILHIDYKIQFQYYNQKVSKPLQIGKETREISTQTDITLLDIIVLNDKNTINGETSGSNNKLNNSDNIKQNITNSIVRNNIEQVNKVIVDKVIIGNKNNKVNQSFNTVNEVSDNNDFFRVSTYQCTSPKH